MGLASHTLCRERKGLVTGRGYHHESHRPRPFCREKKDLVMGSKRPHTMPISDVQKVIPVSE